MIHFTGPTHFTKGFGGWRVSRGYKQLTPPRGYLTYESGEFICIHPGFVTELQAKLRSLRSFGSSQLECTTYNQCLATSNRGSLPIRLLHTSWAGQSHESIEDYCSKKIHHHHRCVGALRLSPSTNNSNNFYTICINNSIDSIRHATKIRDSAKSEMQPHMTRISRENIQRVLSRHAYSALVDPGSHLQVSCKLCWPTLHTTHQELYKSTSWCYPSYYMQWVARLSDKIVAKTFDAI